MTDYSKLYSNGVIAPWYLRPSQLKFHSMLSKMKKVVARCHRRYGKGTTVFTYVFERCLTEKITVRYGTDTQTHAHSIFGYLMEKIFEKCPEFKPKSRGNYYEFHTGSRIYIFGVKDSGEIDKARGEEADIIICDEYGFWKFRAEYVLRSVLAPQTDETDGQIIIVSTPPEDMTHDYVNQVAQAEINNYLFHWDLDDSLRVGERNEKQHQKIIADCGIEGKESVAYKREYLCHMIASQERLVVPEGQNEELYIGECDRPNYYDTYVCMDLGLRDFTAALFGHCNFGESRLVVEDEFVANYTSTSRIVEGCREKEKALEFPQKPFRRIGDCEQQQLFDMSKDHGYEVTPITKRRSQSGRGFADSVINKLRLGIQNGKVLISPKCTNLRTQLKYGIWNERRTDFERTESMGHLDALMALAYLYDNIDWQHNPYPSDFAGMDKYNTHFNEKAKKELNKNNGFGKLIGR